MVVRPGALQVGARQGAGAVAVADHPAVGAPSIPFRGIEPFRYEDHPIFFARGEETRLLTSLVAVHRGVFLYGDSGNGKSSLVNAGLLPEAYRLGYRPVRVRVQPRAGAELVVDHVATAQPGAEAEPFLLAPEDPAAARVVLSIAAFEERVRAACDGSRPLIVFDQFEEILTLFEDKDALALRAELTALIGRLLRDPMPVKLVFAFREDYLGRVNLLLADHPELVDHALRLGPPSADDLHKIIRGPFERFPGHFERELGPALAERLSAALAVRFGTGEVSLSEVQTVCLRLWQSPDPEGLLGEKRIQGLLEDELGEALERFSDDLRLAAVAVLSQMVTSAGTRNVVSAGDLRVRVHEADEDVTPEMVDEALARLEDDAKLIRRERRRDVDLYEITSEFLVPWISERREEARLAAERRRASERERQRLRVFVAIAGALVIVVAAVVVFALQAVRAKDDAVDARNDARQQAKEARALGLVASSREPPAGRPDLSLALAYAAYRERARPETHAAVIRSLQAARTSGVQAVISTPRLSGVAVSPDGRTLASAATDGTLRLWDARTRQPLGAPLKGHRDWVNAADFSPDGRTLASASDDRTVRLWNVRTRTQLGVLRGHEDWVDAVRFSPDGRTLASASDDTTVRLWSVRTRRQVGPSLRGHTHFVNAVAFSPDGRSLASAADDRTVRLWSVRTHRQRGRTLRGHTGAVNAVAFSPDGRTLASAGSDKTVRLWGVRSHEQLRQPLRHRKRAVNDVAFAPDGRTLASAGEDNSVRLWHAKSHRPLARFTGHSSGVSSVAFSADGKRLASAARDSTIRLWNPATRTRADRLPRARSMYHVAISPDGRVLAAAGDAGVVRLWDASTQKPLRSLKVNRGGIRDLAFSPDRRTLAAAGNDGTIRFWDLPTRREVRPRIRHKTAVRRLAFSPEGSILAFVGSGRTFAGDDRIRLVAASTHKALPSLKLPARRGKRTSLGAPLGIQDIAFSPDKPNLTIASVSGDDLLRLWDPSARKPRHSIRMATDGAEAVAFSPDGRTVAYAPSDSTVRLVDLETRKQIGASLVGHTQSVVALRFSPDGKVLASVSADRTIRLWDPKTHKRLARLSDDGREIHRVAFSPDGKTLASVSPERGVRLWRGILWPSPAGLLRSVCAVLPDGVSRAEWNQYAADVPYRLRCP